MCLNQVDALLTSLSTRTYRHDYSNEDDPIVIDENITTTSSPYTDYNNNNVANFNQIPTFSLNRNNSNSKNIFNYVKSNGTGVAGAGFRQFHAISSSPSLLNVKNNNNNNNTNINSTSNLNHFQPHKSNTHNLEFL